MMDDERQRRVLAVLTLVFVLLLVGCSAFFPSSTGTGDLTVTVENQNGQPVSGQQVTVTDPATGRVVYQSQTGPNGEVSTELEVGEYVVEVGGTTDTVEVDEDGADLTLQVSTSPPKWMRDVPWRAR